MVSTEDITVDNVQNTNKDQRSALVKSIRYRAHATDLRCLVKFHHSSAFRRRLLEMAAEFEQLAAEIEHGLPHQ